MASKDDSRSPGKGKDSKQGKVPQRSGPSRKGKARKAPTAFEKGKAKSEKIVPGSRWATFRLAFIVDCLKQELYPSMAKIIDYLEINMGCPAVDKTISRDFDELRTFGYVIEYCPAHRGYSMLVQGIELPRPQFSMTELASLCLVRGSLEAYAGTPVHAALQSAFSKLGVALGDALEINPGLAGFTAPMRKATGAKENFFDDLLVALADQRRVRFHYQKPQEKKPTARLVEPYHVTAREGRWYLIGRDLDRNALRTFALARISGFQLLGKSECFERPTDFRVEDYLRHSLGVMRGPDGAKPREVVIHYDAFAAPYLREQFVHESQVFVEHEDGSLELRLTLDNFLDAERMVLQWGGHAEAVSPPEFRQRLTELCRQLADRHSG